MSTPSLPSAATEPADPTHLQRRARALHLSGLLAHWEAVRANPEHLAWTQALLDWEEAERAQRSLQRRLGAARIGRTLTATGFVAAAAGASRVAVSR